MAYSVIINGVDMREEYGLVLSSKTIGTPEPQTKFLEVPFRDGSIDLSEAVSGTVRYKDRTIDIEMIYVGDNVNGVVAEAYAFIHGRKKEIIFGDDSDYYYIGRCSCAPNLIDDRTARFTITVTAEPFKYEVNSMNKDWLWDSFNFNTGLINELEPMEITTEAKTVTLACRRPLEIPTFSATVPMTITFKGNDYTIPAGETKMYNILFDEGANVMQIHATSDGDVGTLEIIYNGGVL